MLTLNMTPLPRLTERSLTVYGRSHGNGGVSMTEVSGVASHKKLLRRWWAPKILPMDGAVKAVELELTDEEIAYLKNCMCLMPL